MNHKKSEAPSPHASEDNTAKPRMTGSIEAVTIAAPFFGFPVEVVPAFPEVAAGPKLKVGVPGAAPPFPVGIADVAAPGGAVWAAAVAAIAVAVELTPGMPVPEGIACISALVALKLVAAMATSLFSKS